MSLSSSEIASILSGWTSLVGASVRKVRAVVGEPAFLLEVRANGENRSLFFSLAPGGTRLHEITNRPPSPAEPGSFVMLLRKHIVGRRLAGIAQREGDRIVHLAFERQGEVLQLIAELTGRHGNIFLVDADDRVLGSHLPNKSAVRRLYPGTIWVAPGSAPTPRGLRADWPEEPADEFVDGHYREKIERHRVDELRRRVLTPERRRLTKIERSIAAVQRDFEKIDRADDLRAEADLLQQAWGQVGRGAEEITVTDWESGQPRTINLDPRKDLNENIQARYGRYRRLKRGRVHAEARIEKLQAEALEVRDRIEAIENASPEALGQLAPPEPGQTRSRSKEVERKPYHEFVSSDGTAIFVGRGSKDNDALTFRVARGNDVWLHAADFAGSHVIIRSGKQPPGRRTLEEAALLAAHYSKGRSDGVVTVTYTQRKHIRKPRNAPPGRVSVAGGKSIDVRADETTLEALFETRRRGR